jgi:TIR domain
LRRWQWISALSKNASQILAKMTAVPAKFAQVRPQQQAASTTTVFISYANDDKRVADTTCANLEAAGLSCRLSLRDVAPGAQPHPNMEAIDRCGVVVVIISESTNLSLRVWLEVERAVNRGVMLIPMRVQETRLAPTLASYLVTVHWLDALTPPLEPHLELLANKVKRYFAKGATGAS